MDTNLKMSHVSKEGYGAIPDYKEIAEQSKKVAILQVIIVFCARICICALSLACLRTKSFRLVFALS